MSWKRTISVTSALAVLAFGLAVVLCTLAADYWATSAASWLSQPMTPGANGRAMQALRNATGARPDIARNWRLLAQQESADDPRAALASAQRAAALQPGAAANWEALAMIRFQLSDTAGALGALRSAVRHDPGGEMSHWELANLARVLGDRQLFWSQLRAAAMVMDTNIEGDVLTAAESVAGSPAAAAALVALNRRPLVRAVAVRILVHQNALNSAAGLFQQVSGCAPGYEAGVCADSGGQLMRALTVRALASQTRPDYAPILAARVWDHGIAQGLFRGTECHQGAVEDGEFTGDGWINTLCSWGKPGPLSPSFEFGAPGGRAARFDFPGDNREQGVLAQQTIWVRRGTDYQLSWQSRGRAAAGPGGVTAFVISASGAVLASSPVPMAANWQAARLRFSSPAHAKIVTLQFTYTRPSGEVPLQGRAELAAVRLRAATPGGRP